MMNKNFNKYNSDRTSLLLFFFIIVLVFIASLTGWTSESLYLLNSDELIVKLRYYDLSLLTIVLPISLIALIYLLKNHKQAKIFSLGLVVYLAFSFTITLFTCAQNDLFLIYIAVLSLCLFYFAKRFLEIYTSTNFSIDNTIAKIASIVLLISAAIGTFFWLDDAISTLLNKGKEINEWSVKAPQVFDLAVILPFTIYGAIRMMYKKKDGILISLMSMVFYIFIGCSVLLMEIGLILNTQAELDHGKVYGFAFVTLMNIIITIFTYRKII